MKKSVVFEAEKDTKRTIRFKEIVHGPLDEPVIGTVYIPKSTLKELGYEEGCKLSVDITVTR